MAKRVKNQDLGDVQGRYAEDADSILNRNAFRPGDAVLILLAILLVAVVIALASVIVPEVKDNNKEYKDELLITVDLPVSPESGIGLPSVGDRWILLDSNGAECTVRDVRYEEGATLADVTLLRKEAIYRDGEGYLIAGTRISVGGKLYFRRDREEYFAATVTGMNSARFPALEETTETETLPAVEEDVDG